MTEQKFYKVLKDGESCHGGSMKWDLPKQVKGKWKPGKWHSVSGALQMCRNGLHATNEPVEWWLNGAECFEIEVKGHFEFSESDKKICAKQVRLIRPLSDDELAGFRIFRSGFHSISAGRAYASDSASVKAYGSASVKAYGSASVEAYGSASVKAYDSASVEAYGSASVEAYGSASVKASDSASVEAYDSASVEAYGSASVKAYGSASVEAYDSATVISFYSWSKPAVVLSDSAILIDRRFGEPVVSGNFKKAE